MSKSSEILRAKMSRVGRGSTEEDFVDWLYDLIGMLENDEFICDEYEAAASRYKSQLRVANKEIDRLKKLLEKCKKDL